MWHPIYNDDEVVGFAMMAIDKLDEDYFLYTEFGDKTCYELYRFMIDKKHQGKGFAKAAMMKIIEFLRSCPQGKADSIYLSYAMANETARKLFTSVGFVETEHVYTENDKVPCMVARFAL